MITKLKILFRKIINKYNFWRCKKAFKKYWINMPKGYLTKEQIDFFDIRQKELDDKIRKDLLNYFNKNK
jgi:hypothetical protein